MSTSLQTTLAAEAHLAEGQFLLDIILISLTLAWLDGRLINKPLLMCYSHRNNFISEQDSEPDSEYVLEMLARLGQSIIRANDLEKWVFSCFFFIQNAENKGMVIIDSNNIKSMFNNVRIDVYYAYKFIN
jgi:hypothetical protein